MYRNSKMSPPHLVSGPGIYHSNRNSVTIEMVHLSTKPTENALPPSFFQNGERFDRHSCCLALSYMPVCMHTYVCAHACVRVCLRMFMWREEDSLRNHSLGSLPSFMETGLLIGRELGISSQ